MNLTTQKRNKRIVRLLAVILTIVLGVSSALTVAALTKEITVIDGDEETVVTTLNDDTDRVLELAGVTVGYRDEVIRNEEEIEVLRGFYVYVKADGKQHAFTFTRGTVADALREAGVVLGGNDRVTPSKTTELTSGMTIRVQRWHHITITADGATVSYLVPEGDVQDALDYVGLTLGGDDEITVPLDEEVEEGIEICIRRVTYNDVTTTEELSFETVTEKTDELFEGTSEVAIEGETGVRTIVTRERLVDGEVADSTVVSDEVTKAPVDKVVREGTKAKPVTKTPLTVGNGGVLTDQNGNEVKYRSVLTGSCTAYSSADGGAYTSTGQLARFGLVAVNPQVIPYGTRLYICSPDGSFAYGYAIAADTGGALMSGRIIADCFYDTYEQCMTFGRRTMSVYILE